MLERTQIVAVKLYSQFALHAGNGLFHVVGDRLGEIPDNSGVLLQFFIHCGNEFLFVLMKDRPPIFLALQVDEVFGIKKASRIGPIIGTPGLTDHLCYFGKRSHHAASLVREVDARSGTFAGGQCSAHPNGTLIEVGKKLRPDRTADGEIESNSKEQRRNSNRDKPVLDGSSYRDTVMLDEPTHDRVLPFLCAVAEKDAGEHRRNDHGKRKRTQERKCYGPCHWLEKASFDGLQGEDRQIGCDDNSDGVEDRPLYFVRRVANLLKGSARVVLLCKVPDDVFNHYYGAVHNHPEIECAKR